MGVRAMTARPALMPSATAVLLALVMLAGCAGTSKYTGRSVIEHHRDVLRGEVFFPADEPLPQLTTVELTAVNDDMREFLARYVPNPGVSDEFKTRAILKALLDEGLEIKYSSLRTLTAEETFYAREGNCLSFINLFIALAREAGVAASYREVEVPPTWSAVGDTYYYFLHINSIVDFASGQQVVVDFDTRMNTESSRDTRGSRIDRNRDRSRYVADSTAAAQYYNNMAVFYLAEGDLPTAFLHARKAIELRPNTGYFWSNMGTILKRAGDLPHAEKAYLAAIDIDNEPAAYSNLARLYRTQGRMEEATYYADVAERFRAENPYYLYEKAARAYEAGDYSKANKLLGSAIRKRKDEHEFHRLMGLTWARLGQPAKAEKSFVKAASYALSDEQTALYEHKLRLLRRQASNGPQIVHASLSGDGR